MKKHTGGSAQQRRRARRADMRAKMNPRAIEARQAEDFEAITELALVAGASGSTSLPLSERDANWDAGAAEKSLSDAQFGSGHFWRDPDKPADEIGSYKLPFATATGGTLTAVWKGVTGAAGAVQGARGGVKIPSGDVAAVKARIAGYYTKAAKKYGDDNIKVPWAADGEVALDTDEMAFRLAYAELAATADMATLVSDGDLREAFDARLHYWEEALTVAPEDAALEQLDVALTPESGSSHIAEAFVRVRPDLSGFEAEVEEVVAEVLRRAAERIQIEGQTVFTLRDLVFDNAMDLPVQHQPGATMPARTPGAAEPTPPVDGITDGALHWTATIAPEGALTDDGRAFAPDALAWRELPLTLGRMLDTPHADMVVEAPACGRIDRIWREGGVLKAEGIFDSGEIGQETARMVTDGTLRGVSVDTAIHSYEVGPRSQWFDADGNWIAAADAADVEAEPQDLVDLLLGQQDDTIYLITSATIGAVTICPFAAFADAKIMVGESLVAGAIPGIASVTMQGGFTVTERDGSLTAAIDPLLVAMGEEFEQALTASAAGLAPVLPPAEWFDDPQFDELTPVTIDEHGRIFGHAWPWGTCHIGIHDVCTTAPRTLTGYAYFHVGEIECADGERIAVGRLTFDTGHARQGLSRAATLAHYDDTGKVGGYIRVGEDEHGGWIAGSLAADVDAADAQKLRGGAPSGDWRNVDGNLELVALLAVNVPGFPVPRPMAAMVASGEGETVVSLTAAGILIAPDDETLFRVGLEAAVQAGEMTAENRDDLLAVETVLEPFKSEVIAKGREALAARQAVEEADLREVEALAAEAHGTFSDLAAAAHEA